MRVDGREIPVSGSLLQPLLRRTSDIVRLVLSVLLLAAVVAGSLITRNQWRALEASVSDIVGVLSPRQSDLVYLLYGIAIFALPFAILIELIIGRRWKLLAAYGAAALVAGLLLSITGDRVSAPKWHLDADAQLDTLLSQFLDDPRWIAMLAAVLTVSGPWLPPRSRHWWWALLLAFVPIHLLVSKVVPARSILGLSVGWLVGSMIVLVVGTPALEVPLDAAVRVLARRGFVVTRFTVLHPAGPGPLVLAASCGEPASDVIVELYGQNQRSGGAVRQLWRWLSFRSSESDPPQLSLRGAVEHRALMAMAIADLGVASTRSLVVAALDRGWELYAHSPPVGTSIDAAAGQAVLGQVWHSLGVLHAHQIAHGDLRAAEIRNDDGRVLFDGFAHAELGASEAQLQSDIAQLLISMSAIFGEESTVRTAVDALGEEVVVTASGRLTRSAMPSRIRTSVPDAHTVMSALRSEVLKQTGTSQIRVEQVTRFSRSQIIQLVLLIGLVYVAYPYISEVPTFFTELRTVNWWWALLGLGASASTYVGAAAALWACTSGKVKFRYFVIMQVANTFAATTTPAGVGGLAMSVRFLQKGGISATRATAAVTLQQSVQVITHVGLLILFSAVAGTSADLSRFVPDPAVLYLIAGVALGALGACMFVPTLRRWLGNAVRPRLKEVFEELRALAGDQKRFALVVLGCVATTLGNALALWASIEAFGGGATFVTVTVVTMVGGTLASAAPTPGGVGAVEAALIGGLAAFGLPASVAVPSVLLYRVLTCWLPVLCGWPTMRWLSSRDMV